MSTHAKQATVYALMVVATLVGAWLLLSPDPEAEAATEPIPMEDDLIPQIFEAGDRTCVFVGGELECFCSCAVTQACCDALACVISEPLVITVPQVITETVEVPADITSTDVVTDPEATSTVTDTQSLTLSDPDVEVTDPDVEVTDPDVALTDEDGEGKKPKCNQGVGNGPEECSPGQSDNTVNPDHPHDPNDEAVVEGKDDVPVPGDPGRKGGNKSDEDNDKPTKPDK